VGFVFYIAKLPRVDCRDCEPPSSGAVMPHAGPVEPAANPLLQFDQSIAFDRIAPDNVSPAVELLLSQCRGAVERVTDPATPADWEPVVLALEHDTQRLSRAWAAVSHT